MALAGDKLAARQKQFVRNTATGTTTSTTYITSLTTALTCGTAFVAPPSGSVTILFHVASFNSNAGVDCKSAVRVGQGATIGGGTQVYAAVDDDMYLQNGTVAQAGLGGTEVSGLTPGSTYNACIAHKVGANTGSFLYRWLKVLPDP